MHQLQQRLELASVKASNGWTDLSVKEIETVSIKHKQPLDSDGMLTSCRSFLRLPFDLVKLI